MIFSFSSLFSMIILLASYAKVIVKAQNRFSNHIAPNEMMIFRLHALLNFACGDQRSAVGSRPSTTRYDITLKFFKQEKIVKEY